MGRDIRAWDLLSVLLGDEPVLPPHSQYYQRLLGTDQNGARQVLEQQLKDKNLEELDSTVLIPALQVLPSKIGIGMIWMRRR